MFFKPKERELNTFQRFKVEMLLVTIAQRKKFILELYKNFNGDFNFSAEVANDYGINQLYCEIERVMHS